MRSADEMAGRTIYLNVKKTERVMFIKISDDKYWGKGEVINSEKIESVTWLGGIGFNVNFSANHSMKFEYLTKERAAKMYDILNYHLGTLLIDPMFEDDRFQSMTGEEYKSFLISQIKNSEVQIIDFPKNPMV